MKSLLNQLLDFYYQYDACQQGYLSLDKAEAIYQTLLDKDRIHTCIDEDGKLTGYAESFRVNYEQIGKILCGYNMYEHLETENITDGPVAYLANVTVLPDNRRILVFNYLRNKYFIKNQDAEIFCGHERRKKTGLWKVYNRQQAFMKWTKEPAWAAANSNQQQLQ